MSLKKKCLFSQIGKLYIFILLSFKCQFSVSLYLANSFFFLLSTKKTKCPSFSFFFVSQHNVHILLNWESLTKKVGILVTRCFPPLNFGLMGPVFDLIHWELLFLIGPQYAASGRLHTAAFSSRVLSAFSKSVTGHSVYWSTNYLFTCQSFFFLLFNKHSSNELNGRLTNQYWSQRCSTQVVKRAKATKIQNEKILAPLDFLCFFFLFDSDKYAFKSTKLFFFLKSY